MLSNYFNLFIFNIFTIINMEIFLKRHNLRKIKKIKDSVFLCEKDSKKVILKININVPKSLIEKTYNSLNYINSLNIIKTNFPKYLYFSSEDRYVIMTYEDWVEPLWSEFDNDLDTWWGRRISIDYLKLIKQTLIDLKKIDTNIILESEKFDWHQKIDFALNKKHIDDKSYQEYITEIPKLSKIDSLLCAIVSRWLIDNKKKTEIYNFIKNNFKSFYSKNLIVSNFDFYPRNLLEGDSWKIVMIDWDRAGIEIKERMLMFFWMHMFWNKLFQEQLISYYKQSSDYDVNRYRFWLILSLLENIDLWWETKRCTKAFDVMIDYLLNYKKIIN